ncbi:MAG: CRISPR-associated endonuclease Cas1, partial [Porticoccaceae bacterium]
MYSLQNTLYVMTPNAYAHLENNTVRIDVEREKRLQVPLHHLGGLVCFGNVMVSPALMHRLADEGKSLVLLEASGRFKARLEGAVSGNILLRQAHHRSA